MAFSTQHLQTQQAKATDKIPTACAEAIAEIGSSHKARMLERTHMNTTIAEHPPVPQVLQDALKDHPEVVAELQRGLQTVGRNAGMTKAQLTDREKAICGCWTAPWKGLSTSPYTPSKAESDGDDERTESERARFHQIDHSYTGPAGSGFENCAPFFE
ncbi:MAG: hypothetical protein R3E42_05055 [Burkholderiaceae bacterium]